MRGGSVRVWLGWWGAGPWMWLHTKRVGEKDERWTPQLFCSAQASFPTSHLLLHIPPRPWTPDGPWAPRLCCLLLFSGRRSSAARGWL